MMGTRSKTPCRYLVVSKAPVAPKEADFSHHDIARLLTDDHTKSGAQYIMTDTPENQEDPAASLTKLFNLVNAFQVVERAKLDGNYISDASGLVPINVHVQEGASYYFRQLSDESVSAHSYTRQQIMYANYVIDEFERSTSGGSFTGVFKSFEAAARAPRVDPLVFDLNGDRLTTGKRRIIKFFLDPLMTYTDASLEVC